MSELPQISPGLRVSDHTGMKTVRTPRSVDHLRRSSASSVTTVTYAERFHYITKTVNYDQMSDQQVWRQYEKLRDCLKILNEEILAQMQKKAMIIRKVEPPKSKPQQQMLQLLEQEQKVNEIIIRAKKDELTSIEGRIKYLTKQGIREQLQIECEEIIQAIAKLKVQNKDNCRKSKMLGRDLVTAPQQLLDKLLNLEEQLIYADRKFHKLKKRVADSDKIVAESIQKFNEITNAIQSRLEQYKVVERYVEEQINTQTYHQMKNKQENIKKYQSPLKRNYLLKLKDLDVLVSNVIHHDKVITQSQQNILIIRSEIDSIEIILNARRPTVTQQKNYAKPLKYKQNLEESNRRHASMMQIREADDKNNENSTNPTQPTVN